MLEYEPGVDSREIALRVIAEFARRVLLGEYAKEGLMPEIVISSIKKMAEGVMPPAALSISEMGVTLVVLAEDDRRLIING